MTEFKISSGLASEISEMKNAGEALNASIEDLSSDGVSTLKTSMMFIRESQEILELITLYRRLVLKDVADLSNMMSTAEEMDQEMSMR